MPYFKKQKPLAGPLDLLKNKYAMTLVTSPTSQSVATEQSIAFAKTKANWPRCTLTIREQNGTTRKVTGYLYKFKDGRQKCTRDWDQGAYALVVKGEVPPIPVPDLSQVQRGTLKHFEWLCKAQGTVPQDKGVQQVRMGFDRMGEGWEWWPRTDSKGRSWRGYSSAPKPRVLPQNIMPCARYIQRNSGSDASKPGYRNAWTSRAYIYSVDVQGQAAKNVEEHRPSACDDPANGIPPELRAACKAALARNDGTSINSFKKDIGKKSQEEIEEIIYGSGAGGPGGAPQSTYPGAGAGAGIMSNPVVVYGGIAAVVGVVALIALRKK